MRTRKMLAGKSSPVGVYGFACADIDWAGGYNLGCVVIMKFFGAVLNFESASSHLDGVPPGAMAFLRPRKGVHQWACHADGVTITELRFDAECFRRLIESQLDEVGYSAEYHEKLLKIKARGVAQQRSKHQREDLPAGCTFKARPEARPVALAARAAPKAATST